MADYNLQVTQGSDFSIRLTLNDANGSAVDLTAYRVSGSVRDRYSSSSVLLDLSPTIVSGGTPDAIASGLIDITLSATQTANLPVTEAVYDVERIAADGVVNKIIQGKVRVYPEATY